MSSPSVNHSTTAHSTTALPALVRAGARRFKTARADFYEDLAAALDDKAVLSEELVIREKRLTRVRPKEAALYRFWHGRMDSMSFTGALKGTVPALDHLILSAYESSGSLSDGLRYTANMIRQLDELNRALWASIAIPLLLFAMITTMLYGYSLYLIPILEQVIPPESWPFLGKVMYQVAAFATGWGVAVLAAALAAGGWVVYALPRTVGEPRLKLERHLSVFQAYRDYYAAVFLVSLSAMLQSGASLLTGLESVRQLGNPWLRWHIQRIVRALNHTAGNPAQAFNTGLFSQDLYHRISDYGKRSVFSSALSKIGNQVVDRLSKSLKRRAGRLNLLLLLVCGAMLGLMITSVMLTSQHAQTVIRAQTYIR